MNHLLKKLLNTKIMKRIILMLIILIVGTSSFSQSWNWAHSAGGNRPDYAKDMAIDLDNNIYVGITSRSDTCYFKTGYYTLWGETDFFIVKYNSNGNELWVKQCGGPYEPHFGGYSGKDGIIALKYDQTTNSIYGYGGFVGTCNFGEITIGSSSPYDMDIFIAKFNLDGNCIWAKRIGCTNEDERWDRAFSMSIDNYGCLYVCAYLPFSGTFDNTPAEFGGNLAKFDPDGNCLWVKKIIPVQNIGLIPPLFFLYSYIINESLYLTGYNIKSEFTVDTISMSIPNYSGQLIASFDLNGNIKWLKAIGGPTGTSLLKEIDSDDLENIYIPGAFSGSYATFGIDTIFSDTGRGIYVAKYNKEGTLVWLKHADVTNSANASSVNRDSKGFLYLSGGFSGTINFDSFQLNSISENDLYIIKFDQEGNFLCGDNTNGGAIYYLRTYPNDIINICGSFFGTANFGNTVLFEKGAVWGDVFVAQHAPINEGINEHNSKISNALIIYANPTTGICNIKIPEELWHEENLTLLVYDNSGKLILQQEINTQEEKISLNLEARAKGIYNAILTNGKQKFQGRVVFE